MLDSFLPSILADLLLNHYEKCMQDVPYYPISRFYKSRFGEKVHKIPVSVAEDCPNRLGLRGMKACVFCDEWGSAAYPENREEDITEQIRLNRDVIAKRYKAKKFLVYFQAYTNTFLSLKKLQGLVETALQEPDVVGVVFGTRPDCLSKGVLNFWNELCERTFVAVELGVQSFENEHLEFMQRGHSAEKSLEAIHKVKAETKVDLGIHLMFGWPNETDDQVIKAANICSSLPISNVKLHNLHVLKKTPLEKMYLDKKFEPVTIEQYAHWVSLFIQKLRPDIAVHRLGAVANRWEDLVAPEWAAHKLRTSQYLIDYLKDRGVQQGELC